VVITKKEDAAREILWLEAAMQIQEERPAVNRSGMKAVIVIPVLWTAHVRLSALIVRRPSANITAIINALREMYQLKAVRQKTIRKHFAEHLRVNVDR
jgi:hypothetical protein